MRHYVNYIGSIIAAMLAGRTVDELLADIFVPDISTRFMHEGIRWFPPITTQVGLNP